VWSRSRRVLRHQALRAPVERSARRDPRGPVRRDLQARPRHVAVQGLCPAGPVRRRSSQLPLTGALPRAARLTAVPGSRTCPTVPPPAPPTASPCRSAPPPRAARSPSTARRAVGHLRRPPGRHRRVDVPAPRAVAGLRLRHADRLEGPEWHDVGPLDDAATAELTARRERWRAALNGKGWRPPQPMDPVRRQGRLQGRDRLPTPPAHLRITRNPPTAQLVLTRYICARQSDHPAPLAPLR
jgi:hypothetical protein